MSVVLPWVEVCGTDRGYQRHRYWKSVTCGPCRKAHRDYERERRERRKREAATVRHLVPCGSPSAYRRHIRRGEIACDACLAAHAADVARYLKRRRAAA